MRRECGVEMRDALGHEADVVVLRQLTLLVLAGFVAVVGILAFLILASIQAVTTIDAATAAHEREQVLRAIAASPLPINAVTADAMARTLDLDGARLVRADSLRPGELDVPIGTDLILAWQPHRIGSNTFVQIAPLRIGGGILFLGFVGLIGWRLYVIARRLDRRRMAAARLAATDTLTGLANRLAFDTALAERFASGAVEHPFALVTIDLDGFKAVNDTRGHAAGDRLLQQVGEQLRQATAPGDTVARVGGDEFFVLRSTVGVEAFVADIRERIAAKGQGVAASFGIARSDDFPYSITALTHAADAALYRAKRAGRGSAELAIPVAPAA